MIFSESDHDLIKKNILVNGLDLIKKFKSTGWILIPFKLMF